MEMVFLISGSDQKVHMFREVRSILLPPANEVCEGYVFTRVCLSTGGEGSPGPHPGGRLRGLAWGGSSGPYLGGFIPA